MKRKREQWNDIIRNKLIDWVKPFERQIETPVRQKSLTDSQLVEDKHATHYTHYNFCSIKLVSKRSNSRVLPPESSLTNTVRGWEKRKDMWTYCKSQNQNWKGTWMNQKIPRREKVASRKSNLDGSLKHGFQHTHTHTRPKPITTFISGSLCGQGTHSCLTASQ